MGAKSRSAEGDAVWEVGRAAWPAVRLNRADLDAYLRERHRKGKGLEAVTEAADVYLVCACLTGIPEAIAAFEETQMRPLGGILRRHVKVDPAVLDDVLQRLREDLFARGDRPSKLLSYSGQGKLRAWLTTIALRSARETLPTHSKAPESLSKAVAVYPRSPELEALESAHRDDFRAAFSEAMGILSVRERNVLRLHLLDGLGIDKVGALFNVHRATAARWISAAREKLVGETRRRVSQRLKLSATEVESLMALLHSQLDLSISRHLRGDGS